jgi:hypothetical protein
LPQPGKRALASARAHRQQPVERVTLYRCESVGQSPPQLPMRAGLNLTPEPFDDRQWRKNDAIAAQLIEKHGDERRCVLGGERGWQ